jgi:hypothetical protein
MHNIVYDKEKKALVATLSGNIGIEQANGMLADFKKAVAGLNAKEHILVIQPEKISASLLVIPILQSFIQMVGQLNFKKIYIIDSDKYAGIIKQSLSGYSVGNNIVFASSIKDALNK